MQLRSEFFTAFGEAGFHPSNKNKIISLGSEKYAISFYKFKRFKGL
jgi:hypothetical protein